MKILIINCVYKVGSTGKIVECISSTLREYGHEVYTCYGIGNSYYDNFSKKICTNIEHKINALRYRIDGFPYGGIYFSNWRLEKLIEKMSPDIVNIHCINASMINVYDLLKYLAKNNIKTVVTLHAEFFYTGGCDHAFDCEQWKTKCVKCSIYKKRFGLYFRERSKLGWEKMNEAFKNFKNNNIAFTAVSPWLLNRAKESSILKGREIVYIPNGLDSNIFHLKNHTPILNKKGYDKLILFVTPDYNQNIDDLKGGRYIPLLAQKLPRYKFIIVCSKCSSDIIKLPKNVQLYGRAKSQSDLALMYSEADVSLILSRRETFSMVTAESLSCGTPVVGFKAGGPESIAIKQYSEFVDYGNLELLVDAINTMAYKNIDKNYVSKLGIEYYSKHVMAKKFQDLFYNLKKK